MKKFILILFLLTTKLTFGQIKNSSFENWDSTYTAYYDYELVDSFAVLNPVGGIPSGWRYPNDWNTFGINRTTDSYSGNYSLLLNNWYNYGKQEIQYKDTISFRPLYFQGYFKYITGGINGLSQGTAKVILTRFNGTSNDTIGTGIYLFDSTAYFIPFQLNINYLSSLNPDSIHINIINANSVCGSTSYSVCHLLYLDNLTLTTTPLSIDNLISTENVARVYPNPFSTQTTFQTDKILKDATLTVYNSFGQLVKQIKNISGQTVVLSRDNLPSGLYFIQLKQDNTIYIEKLVIND